MNKLLFFLLFLCGHLFVLLQAFLPERTTKTHLHQRQHRQHRQHQTTTTSSASTSTSLRPKGDKQDNENDDSNDKKPKDKIKMADSSGPKAKKKKKVRKSKATDAKKKKIGTSKNDASKEQTFKKIKGGEQKKTGKLKAQKSKEKAVKRKKKVSKKKGSKQKRSGKTKAQKSKEKETSAALESRATGLDSLKQFLEQHRTALLNSIRHVQKLVNNDVQVNALLRIIDGDDPLEALREAISEDKKHAAAAVISKRTSVPKEQEQGGEVGTMKFINHLIDNIPDDDWEGFLMIIVYQKQDLEQDESNQRGKRKTKDEMKKSIDENFGTKKIIEIEAEVRNADESVRKYGVYRPPFKLQAIDDDWSETKENVLKFLKSTTHAILNPMPNDGLPLFKISKDLVDYDSQGTSLRSMLDSRQTDKAHAVVIAGESGSGKTVFSVLLAQQREFRVLYCALESQDFGPNKQRPQRDCTEWHDFIMHVISYLQKDQDVQNLIDLLYDIKSKLNKERNKRASDVAKQALERVVPNDPKIRDWFGGKFKPSNRPEKVAIILDEATDQDFARGMVDIVREFVAEHQKLARNEVILILAGTGLDAITFDKMKRVGTNPSKSRLITMQRPRIEKVVDLQAPSVNCSASVIKESIEAGLLSRVLSQNSRMFFRAVLPIMLLGIFYRDGDYDESMYESRLRERLIEVGAVRPLMDYGVRYYVGNNSILTLTAANRSMLSKQTFLYHLLKSMVDALSCMDDADLESKKGSESKNELKPKEDATLKKVLTDELRRVSEFEPCVQPLTENEDISFKKVLLDNNSNKGIAVPKPDEFAELVSASDIFVNGLASVKGTSAALKYMACFGLTHRLRVGFGETLEVMVAMHVARYAEIQGYHPVLIELKNGWPHKSSMGNDNITEEVICDLKQELDNVYKDEQDHLNSTSSFSGKKCIILSQGTSTAQGPDIFAVYIDETSAMLDLIQCKHFQKAPSAETMTKWWRSLGIEFDDKKKTYVEEPKVGSAGYSYTGIESLRDCLGRLVQKKVTIGRRIIATSLGASSLRQLGIPKCGAVWCKELLEPTISILPANASYAEDDTKTFPKAKMDDT